MLLERGADLAFPTASGWTPLKAAATEGHVEIVKLLLGRGADVDVED